MPFKNPHPIYGIWQGMRRRCLTPTFKQWSDYGGRGIKICPEWDDFHQFVKDMGPRPSPKHTLDRIDNDGDYCPENCRWATKKEQQRNQRRAVYVTIDGHQYRAIELAEKAGVKPDTIVSRAREGLPLQQVLSAGRVRSRRRNQTHCKYGHEFTPENTYITPQGWRNCRTCHNEKMRRRIAASRSKKGDQVGNPTRWNAKLSEAQVREIKALKGQLPTKKIAAIVGVSIHNVRDVHRGRSYAWIGVV